MVLRRSDLEDDKPCQFIIFGGTGDLAHTKLIPAIYKLLEKDTLIDNFSIISIGRRNNLKEDYTTSLYLALEEAVSGRVREDIWEKLKGMIDYRRANFEDDSTYKELKNHLNELDYNNGEEANRVFYLAVAPKFFELIVHKLDRYGMVDSLTGSWRRLVIEKPFGYDLESAHLLNEKISQVFSEYNIYRIDHYLGKDMIQSLLIIRFANLLFEPLWNNRYIDNVQIISNESNGIKGRGSYYESAGALNDVVQNHILQMLSLIAMEAPTNMETKDIRDEKVKVLKSLVGGERGEIDSWAVRGQYGEGEKAISYREEDWVDENSNTETFVALKLMVDNLRWSGVPFYIKTGKRLSEKSIQITIEFKENFHSAFSAKGELKPNLLVIKIQPNEGVQLRFNAKKLGSDSTIIPVNMDFCQNCQAGMQSPEAYENLIHNVIIGDQTLFTRWDEVENAWLFIDKIADYWKEREADFPNYKAGSVGPQKSKDLLNKDGRRWWDEDI